MNNTLGSTNIKLGRNSQLMLFSSMLLLVAFVGYLSIFKINEYNMSPENLAKQDRLIERMEKIKKLSEPKIATQSTSPSTIHHSCPTFKSNEKMEINGCANIESSGEGYAMSFFFNRTPHISGKYKMLYKGNLVCQTVDSSLSNYSSDQCENVLKNEITYPVTLQDFVLQFNETITIYERK